MSNKGEEKEISKDKKEEQTEEKNNKKGLQLKIVVAIIIVLLIVVCGKFAYDKLKDEDSVSGVRKLLTTKYVDISCINLSCDGFVAIDGDKLSKYKVSLYNLDGKKVADYKVKYKSDDKTTEIPIDISDNFYISTTVSVKNSLNILKYSIKNKKNKTIFETENKLSIINNDLISMKSDKTYILLNKKGKTIYSNISDIDTYVDGKYNVIKVGDTYSILNSKGKKILDGYKIAKIVKDENDNEVFAIVKNVKDNIYNYYDLSKKKVIGDGFNNYTQNKNSLQFTITKKENEKDVKYLLKENGKQEKLEEDLDKFKDNLKEKIDSKIYKLYTNSIYKVNQEYVFVDNLTDKSFGIYELKENKYTELYKYKSDRRYFNSGVTKLKSENENNSYFKLSCISSYCDNNQTIIYDLNKKDILYKSNSTISDYLEYENGYKVIKFSYDEKYNSNYVIFDKNNKELLTSKNKLVIIDKDLIIGSESNYSLSLYSVKKGKLLNDNLVTASTIENNKVYKYTDENKNTIILNSKGEEKIRVKDDEYLKLSSNSYVYINDNKLNIYNIEKDKTYKYKLKENEKLNNSSGKVISPYRNAIFINNSTDNYVKIIDFKANQIKKINKAQIYSINRKDKKAYMIVKKVSEKSDLYGLYVVE